MTNRLPLTHTNIIELLKLQSLPLDEKKEILQSSLELIETRTFNRVAELLDDVGRQEFTELAEKEDLVAIQTLMDKKQIDILAITEEEVEKLKMELQDEVGQPNLL
ncbi:MAG: hypothetical protein AAB617_01985 [Patescibacteria group bacterium]|mgnify:CR=1 FL=1